MVPSYSRDRTPIWRFRSLARRTWARELFVFAAFLVLSILATWPLAAHMRTHIIDYGFDDPLLYMRITRCVHDWFLGRAGNGGLFDLDFFFPHPLAVTSTDPALGIAFLTLPLRIFTDDYVFIVNFATLLSFPLAAHGTYLLIKELWPSRPGAFVGGLLFAFCLFRIRHLDHPNVLQMQWLPYSLAFLHRMRFKPSLANTAFLAFFLSAALCASCNIGLYSAPIYLLAVPWVVFTAPSRHRWLVAARVFSAGLAAAVVAYGVYRNYLTVSSIWMRSKEISEVILYSAKIENFLAAPAFSRVYGGTLAGNASPEGPMFAGVVTLALAGIGLGSASRVFLWLRSAGGPSAMARHARSFANQSNRDVCFYTGLGLLYAVISLGPEIRYRDRLLSGGIWHLMVQLPGYANVRTPGRFYFFTILCIAIVAGYGLSLVLRRIPGQRIRFCVAGATATLALLELRVAPIPIRRLVTLDIAPAVYTALKLAPKPGAVAELPLNWNIEGRKPMLFANIYRRPTVNAVTGFSLPWVERLFDENMREGHGKAALQSLNTAGLRYIVLHRSELDSEQLARYEEILSLAQAVPIGSFGSDNLFELPNPPPHDPLSSATTLVTISQGKAVGSTPWPSRRRVLLDIAIASKSGLFVYQPGLTKLEMVLEINERKRRYPLYLAPVLVHPDEPQIERREVDLDLPTGRYPAKVSIVDAKKVTLFVQELDVTVP